MKRYRFSDVIIIQRFASIGSRRPYAREFLRTHVRIKTGTIEGHGNCPSLLKTETINFGYRYINDSEVRRSYIRQAEFLSKTLRWEFECGRLTLSEAARDAKEIRNAIMEASRVDTSDMGLADAQKLKPTGETLSSLEGRYSTKLFNRGFSVLSQEEKNRVWLNC